MGACSSVHKAKNSAVSPHRKKPVMNGDENTAQMVGSVFSLKTSELGSKDESFFDSRAWLDSDCDDDFFSVNGDFTPSRGTTPNNQTSISTVVAPTAFSFVKFPDNKLEPSPNGRKKLCDLFQEQESPQANGSIEKLEKTKIPTAVEDGEAKYRKKVGQCCLPSFSERSQNMSPVQ